jgi:Tfp pilus assembly protein PilX
MAIKKSQRGFVLLIAVIFMSVMLSFALSIGSLAYKQQILASSATDSQYAFYAADTALECALYADQRENFFSTTTVPYMYCDNTVAVSGTIADTGTDWVITNRLSLGAGTRCADITVYKPDGTVPGATTYLFAEGYSASCTTVASPSGARFVVRGVNARY